jgi:decaprenylphospho-beta-D-erythro-pentofuranosid-2-ulose 2-reductase
MRVLILGATSAIAQASARVWAARGATLHLAARNESRLKAVAEDLRARGAQVETSMQDLNDASLHERLLVDIPDIILVAQGVQGEPSQVDASPELSENVLRTNLLAPVQFLALASTRLKPGACIAAISSVAGDRGRAKSGAVYGASKAGLDAFLSGLRQRLFKSGIAVVTIKPGFVDTTMTAHLPRNPLFASPEKVGAAIVRAIDQRKAVVYLPWFWKWILVIVRSIPESIFRKLSF